MARLAVMPARGGSKRIPRKNIVPFGGAPLMAHALRAASESGLFDTIHVSTEDAEIADTAAALGFPPDFPRDAALADDHATVLAVLAWVLCAYAERGTDFTSVTLLMPAAPLIEAADLVAAHGLFDAHRGERAVLAAARLPIPVEWAFRRAEDGALTAIQPGMDVVRSQDLPEAWYDSGTFLILPAALATGEPPGQWLGYALPRWKAVDIDTEEDLALARMLFRGRTGT